LLVSAGAAVAAGSRLALASRFAPDVFWSEVRRYGATVAFYAGDLCRHLVDAPVTHGERTHPLRLLAGSGMRTDVWSRVRDRFDVGVLEFYASTQVNLVLANASGEKVGSIGRPLPGSRDSLVAAFDPATTELVRDAHGWVTPADDDRPGLFLVLVDPMARSPLDESSLDTTSLDAPRIVRDVRAKGDAWFVTHDLLARDAEGDHWFVDTVSDVIRTSDGIVSTRSIEDALYELPSVRVAAAYVVKLGDADVAAAAIVPREGASLEPATILERFARSPELTPKVVRFVDAIAESDGYKAIKSALRRGGVPADGHTHVLDEAAGRYRPV
jgi:putative long chain acyl-CoA synthase